MSKLGNIVGKGLILGALASGCGSENYLPQEPERQVVEGIPSSVVYLGGTNGAVSFYIRAEGGKSICCDRHGKVSDSMKYMHAAVLVEGEVVDGDSEPVSVRGYMVDGRMHKIDRVSANGRTVEIKPRK
jgi:hypothetical protein